MSDAVQIPAQAVAFFLWKLSPRKVEREGRKPVDGWSQRKLLMAPDASGRAAQVFPRAAFNFEAIRSAYGAGRYRAEWLGSDHRKLGAGMTVTFELRDPEAAAAPPAGAHHAPHAPAPAGMAGPDGQPMSPWALMAMIDQRAEREAERARADAERSQQRDREFFALLIKGAPAINASNGTAVAAAGVSPEMAQREADLLKREMRLEMREAVAKMRAELEAEYASDDDDEDFVPSKTVGEAAKRVGIKLIGELEEQAPDLLKAAIPEIVDRLKKAGFTPSKELEREIKGGASKPNGAAKRAPAVTEADVDEAVRRATEGN